jgi:hypothetical protein
MAWVASATFGIAAAMPAWAQPAAPSRGLVLVLSPEIEDDVTRNAMVRIRGELAAAPFEVVNRTLDGSVDLMFQVEGAGHDLSPTAAFAIVREPGDSPRSVAVWVSNRMTRTTTVARVAVRGGDIDGAAAQLAIEAVEIVRASLAGLWPTPAPPPPDEAPAPNPAPGRQLALAIGVGALAPMEDAPVFFAPTLGIAVARPGKIGVRLWAFGLGPGADVSIGNGSGARLQRAALAAGLVRVFRDGATVQPIVSLGAGVDYLHVRGTGAPADFELFDRTSWSALLTAGAGCAVRVGAHLALTAEVEALFTRPSRQVEVDGQIAARFERPSVFVHGGLLARF